MVSVYCLCGKESVPISLKTLLIQNNHALLAHLGQIEMTKGDIMQVRYIVCAAPNPCLVSRGKKLEPSGGKSDKLIGRTRIRRTRDEEQELPPDIKGRTELEDIATSGVLVAQLWDCTGTCDASRQRSVWLIG